MLRTLLFLAGAVMDAIGAALAGPRIAFLPRIKGKGGRERGGHGFGTIQQRGQIASVGCLRVKLTPQALTC